MLICKITSFFDGALLCQTGSHNIVMLTELIKVFFFSFFFFFLRQLVYLNNQVFVFKNKITSLQVEDYRSNIASVDKRVGLTHVIRMLQNFVALLYQSLIAL